MSLSYQHNWQNDELMAMPFYQLLGLILSARDLIQLACLNNRLIKVSHDKIDNDLLMYVLKAFKWTREATSELWFGRRAVIDEFDLIRCNLRSMESSM